MTTEITTNKDFDFEVSSGWVAIPRKIQDEIFYTDSHFIHLFLHIILNINRRDGMFQGVVIKKYQMLTGRKSLSEKTGINESKIERILSKLEELKYIEQQKTTKYRVITMLDKSMLEIFEQQKTTTQQQTNNKKHKQQVEQVEQIEQYNFMDIAGDNSVITEDNTTITDDNLNVNVNVNDNVNVNVKVNENKNKKEEIVNLVLHNWNVRFFEMHNLSKIRNIDKTRETNLFKRLEECDKNNLNNAVKIFFNAWNEKIKSNHFYRGENDRNWKMDFDFAITKSKFTPVLEEYLQNKEVGNDY